MENTYYTHNIESLLTRLDVLESFDMAGEIVMLGENGKLRFEDWDYNSTVLAVLLSMEKNSKLRIKSVTLSAKGYYEDRQLREALLKGSKNTISNILGLSRLNDEEIQIDIAKVDQLFELDPYGGHLAYDLFNNLIVVVEITSDQHQIISKDIDEIFLNLKNTSSWINDNKERFNYWEFILLLEQFVDQKNVSKVYPAIISISQRDWDGVLQKALKTKKIPKSLKDFDYSNIKNWTKLLLKVAEKTHFFSIEESKNNILNITINSSVDEYFDLKQSSTNDNLIRIYPNDHKITYENKSVYFNERSKASNAMHILLKSPDYTVNRNDYESACDIEYTDSKRTELRDKGRSINQKIHKKLSLPSFLELHLDYLVIDPRYRQQIKVEKSGVV